MKCAWKELLAVVPPAMRQEVDKLGSQHLQQLRLRLGRKARLELGSGSIELSNVVTEQDLRHCINIATQYSPWNANTMKHGYITAPGGHRIGVCADAGTNSGQMQRLTSVNIRVARDFPGIAKEIHIGSNILILGPPGSGKTTLLRDFVRMISRQMAISVVDERQEIFPDGLNWGEQTDVLRGWSKVKGIEIALRTMAPTYIAVDEITAAADCAALKDALWCGVRLVATAHAASREDLLSRNVYRPIVESGCFEELIILRQDKSFYQERMIV